MNLLAPLRSFLRKFKSWVWFQELNREGWQQSYRRYRIQKVILKTSPIRTQKKGSTEVRILTWRRDWMNCLWALKSFYLYSEVDYPLFIHDGGLSVSQREELQRHFPDATLVPRIEADRKVEEYLKQRGYENSICYRRINVSTLKVFDFFILSEADSVISIDSDIVFFKNPKELLDQSSASGSAPKNRYNRDMEFAYSMKEEELESAFGIRPPSLINSGLSRVTRSSIDFKKIEQWLAHPKLFQDKWVTEQTLHALCSSLYGVELLPETYLVSTTEGLTSDLVCKHYPGFFRPLLYAEGMHHLIAQTDFLERARQRKT